MQMRFRNALLSTAAAVAVACGGPILADEKPNPPRRVNIIVIFTDDHGYADMSCQGSLPDLKTPHLDRLAADGVRCTSGYITAPQCIPSRAGILSGRYQTRFGVDHNGTIPMPLDETLIPQRLQSAGYVTGMVGKWHLDPNHQQREWIREHMPDKANQKRVSIPGSLRTAYEPDQRGFTDVFCGHINSYRATYDLDGSSVKPTKMLRKPGYRLDIQTDAALAFIDRHAEEPFFLYLAYFAPHVPLEATEKYLKRFPENMPRRRRIALAMIAAMDDGVGRIRERLAKHAITENTLIFFISDNGAPLKLHMTDAPGGGPGWDGSRNDPWIGEKGTLMEGGVRVPYVVTWPGTLPAGKTYDHPVSSLDVGATAVSLAGLPDVPGLDGVNILPYLKGEKAEAPHETLYWRFWNQTAIRKGKWKYLQAGPRKYLFDMSTPEHETRNRIADEPEIAAALQADLKTWAAEQKTPGVPSETLNGQEVKFYDFFLGGVAGRADNQRNKDHD
jgi:arylsulfatase A-like enzyme